MPICSICQWGSRGKIMKFGVSSSGVVKCKRILNKDIRPVDLIIIVVVIGVVIAMVVMMFRYAGFIHRFPQQGESEDRKEKREDESSSDDRPS